MGRKKGGIDSVSGPNSKPSPNSKPNKGTRTCAGEDSNGDIIQDTLSDTQRHEEVLMTGGKPPAEVVVEGCPPKDASLAGSFEQVFHPVCGETLEDYERVLYSFAAHFQPNDPVSRELVSRMVIIHFDIKRTENAMSRITQKIYAEQPEQWLKLHATYVTQRDGLLAASQRLMTYVDQLNASAPDSDDDLGSDVLDADGNRKVERRFWNLHKFSLQANDSLNKAQEVIRYVDGGAECGQIVQLDDFMDGEFMKPEYGLGDHFRMMLRRYRHPLHHPFDPARIRD